MSFESNDEPFIIGVLGKDPFGSFLDETVAGENVKGHPMEVKRYKDIDDLGNCHILFIKLPGKTKEIIEAVKNKNTVTVCEEADFYGYRRNGEIFFRK